MAKQEPGKKPVHKTLDDPREEIFARAVATGMSAKAAYLHAKLGGKPEHAAVYAMRRLRKPTVKKRVSEHRHNMLGSNRRKIEMGRDWVLKTSKELLEACMQEIPIRDRHGEETGLTKPVEPASATKMLHLLGLEYGLFNPERKSRHGQLDPLDAMNEQQLVQFIGQTLKDLGPGALKELGLVVAEPRVGADGEAREELDDSPAGLLQTQH